MTAKILYLRKIFKMLEDMELFERLMNNLNDCDDVDQIYHNVANYDEGE